MNILFVCSRNQWRSKTAETLYKGRQEHQVRSAGTAASARIKVSAKHILWADCIFVMEQKHKQRLFEAFPDEMQGKRIVVLDIEDVYTYMDEELIDSLKASVDPFL